MADPWASPDWVASLAAGAVGADLGAAGLNGDVVVAVPPSSARRGSRTASAGAPAAGEVRVTFHVVDGRVEAWEPGAPDGAALVTFTLPAPDAREALGGVEPSVLYMQGRLKVDGDAGAALVVLAATGRPGWGDAVAARA